MPKVSRGEVYNGGMRYPLFVFLGVLLAACAKEVPTPEVRVSEPTTPVSQPAQQQVQQQQGVPQSDNGQAYFSYLAEWWASRRNVSQSTLMDRGDYERMMSFFNGNVARMDSQVVKQEVEWQQSLMQSSEQAERSQRSTLRSMLESLNNQHRPDACATAHQLLITHLGKYPMELDMTTVAKSPSASDYKSQLQQINAEMARCAMNSGASFVPFAPEGYVLPSNKVSFAELEDARNALAQRTQ
jgi:hypothetical protein